MKSETTISLPILPLDADAFAPYGWLLGKPFPEDSDVPRFRNAATDFYQEHVFQSGSGGETEILWVNYRSSDRAVATLEAHLLTEQAIIPLSGEIIQIVAMSGADAQPDPASLQAFYVQPGWGICMRPGIWHATRVIHREAQCMMLTRRSTTVDLIGHLAGGKPMAESRLTAIPAVNLVTSL